MFPYIDISQVAPGRPSSLPRPSEARRLAAAPRVTTHRLRWIFPRHSTSTEESWPSQISVRPSQSRQSRLRYQGHFWKAPRVSATVVSPPPLSDYEPWGVEVWGQQGQQCSLIVYKIQPGYRVGGPGSGGGIKFIPPALERALQATAAANEF